MRRPLGSILLWASLFWAASAGGADRRGMAPKHHAAHAAENARSRPKSIAATPKGKKSSRSRRGTRRRVPEAPPPMPSAIEVQAIDPENGIVRLMLLGPSRAPEPRLFVLTDERGRRFVPLIAQCAPKDALTAAAAKKAETGGGDDPIEAKDAPELCWECSLTIAPLYRRAALTGVAMEWGERAVSAIPGQVSSRWAAAKSAPHAEAAGPSDAPETSQPAGDAPVPGETPPASASSTGSGNGKEDTKDEPPSSKPTQPTQEDAKEDRAEDESELE